MRRDSRVLVVVFTLGCLALAASAFAQTAGGSAAIAGTVKDTSGAVLPGVTVEAASPALIERVRSVVTDGQGQYKIVNLPVGTYSVTFSLAGFQTAKRDGIELTTNFTAPVAVELAVGSLQETVTVSGEAPVVDVSNTAVRRVISRELLDSMPNGKTMLSLIGLTPGMGGNPSSQDVGGTKGDQMPFFSFHGSASGDSKLQSNGFNVNIGGASGRVFVPSPMNTQEIAIELGGGNAEQPISGIQFNYISKSGSNNVSGDVIGSWTNHNFQSANFNSDLAARGMSASSINRLDRIGDVGIGVGGPIQVNKLWYFTSYRYWAAGTFVAGQYFNANANSHLPIAFDTNRPVINDYWGHDASIRLTWQATTRNKFDFHYEWEKRCDCHHLQGNNANFAGLASGEATDYQIFIPADMFQTEWTFPATNKLLFNGGVQFSRPTYRTNFQRGLPADAVSIVDSVTGQRWGAEAPSPNPPYQVPSHRDKVEPRFSATYVTGSHAFKGGFNLIHDWGQLTTNDQPNNMSWTYANRVPTTVTEWGTPYTVRENMKAELGVFGQDQWTLKRLTVNYGLRWDYVKLDVPAQSLDATKLRPIVVNTNPVTCSPCQSDFNPRVSASYDVFGNGKTAIKGGLGRYSAARGNSVFNPANSIVQSASRQWTDGNGNFFPDCDLLNNAANGECGPQNNARFGTVNVVTNIADNARIDYRKYNWQATAGLQQELLPGTSLSVTYVRTSWYNFTLTDNLAVTALGQGTGSVGDFDPYCIPVPTDSRLPLSGQPLCGLYAVSAAKFSTQTTNNLIMRQTDFPGGAQTDIFNGVDVTINARLPHGAFLTGGTSTGRERFNNCYAAARPDLVPLAYSNFSSAATTLSNNPSGFCSVVPPFQTQLKLQGSYPLPWDFQLSGSFGSGPGIPILASYQIPNALVAPSLGRNLPGNVSSVNIAAIIAPLTLFEDRINQFDLRLTKIFKLAGSRRFRANLDIYNVLNGSGILSENYTYGPAWQKPTQILDGRMFKFGGQVSF